MSISGRNRARGTLGTVIAMALVACGGDDGQQVASGQRWEPSAAVEPSGEVAPPTLESVGFDATEAVPGRPLEVLVQSRGGGTRSLEHRFTWRVLGQRMPAEGSTIVVPDHLRRGDRIEVEVVATDGDRSSDPRVAAIEVGNRAPRISELGIRVLPGADEGDLGEWVADPVAEDPDGDDVRFRYEWRVVGRGVVSENERLPRDGWRRGDEIQLVAWPSDDLEEGRSLESAPLVVGNSAPVIVSRPPALDPSGRFVYPVRAEDRDGDRGLRFELIDGPESMALDPFSGEVRWTATPDDVGEHLVVLEVDDRKGGKSRQRFFVEVSVSEPAPPAAAAN